MRIEVEIGRPRWLRRVPNWVIGSLCGLAVLTVVGPPMYVLASHQFTDVPDSNAFHNDISNLVNAGITGGCGAGIYCPDSNVRRDTMAAFFGRGLGRVGMSTTLLASTIDPAAGFVPVVQKAITVPGVSGTQFVHVQGSVTVFGTPTGCPCNINSRIADATGNVLGSVDFYRFNEVYDQHVVTSQWAFAVPPGSRTFQLQVAVFQATSAFSLFNPKLVVTTYPYGATGGNTLGPEAQFGAPEQATPDGMPLLLVPPGS